VAWFVGLGVCCGAVAAERLPCSNRSISPARRAHDGIPYQGKQRAGDRGITAENMEKSQHTDFNEDTTNESASVACSNMRL